MPLGPSPKHALFRNSRGFEVGAKIGEAKACVRE
jgi:hypothetical protein